MLFEFPTESERVNYNIPEKMLTEGSAVSE